ncbi:hypothetical protein D3C87_2129120 [compost metagenome]
MTSGARPARSIASLMGLSLAKYDRVAVPNSTTPCDIRRNSSGPFKPISLKPLMSAVTCPLDSSGMVLVQNGFS